MRGHIRKAKDRNGNLLKDAWDVVIDLPKDLNNPKKRKQKWKRVRGSKRDAEKVLNELLHEINSGKFSIDENDSFEDHLQNWLLLKENSVSWNTYVDYRAIINKHLIPKLGTLKLSDIEPEHISSYYSEKVKEGLSVETVRKHHRVLRSVFKPLVIRGKIRYNPMDLIKPPISAVEFEATILTRQQIIDVIALAKIVKTKIYLVVLLALSTGMRRSEIAGLKWDSLDLESGVIWVRRQYQRTRNGLQFTKTKNKGKNAFKLPPFVVSELIECKKEQEINKSMLGSDYQENNLVCCWPDGRPYKPDWISRQWRKFREEAGLNVRLHDTRHSHVTLLTEFRVSDKEIQERVGHFTKEMKDRYTHVTSEMNNQIARLLEDTIFHDVQNKINSQKIKKPKT